MSLKNKKNKINSLTFRQYLLPVGKKHSSNTQETPLCTSVRQASFTVEAAVVLPIFICCMVAVLFFFRVMQVEAGVEMALHETARELAICAHYPEESNQTLNLAAAKAIFTAKTTHSPAVSAFVPGGTMGISLIQSEFTDQQIDLIAKYQVRFPLAILGRQQIMLKQRVVCNTWRGRMQQGQSESYVYVTQNGRVYHLTRQCPYLDLSIRMVNYDQINTSRNSGGEKYKKCRSCGRLPVTGNSVYVTDYGDSYHMSLNCSGLKRTVYVIPLSEVGGRPPCSKCGQENGRCNS